jgi:hypothetical protein
MSYHNNLLFNAALNGFIEGCLQGRPPTGVTSVDDVAASYAALYAAGVSYATSLDTLILEDTSISGALGVTLAPTTAAIAANQYAKVTAMTTLSAAAFANQYPTGLPATTGFYVVQATEVAAQYAEAIATFTAQATLD